MEINYETLYPWAKPKVMKQKLVYIDLPTLVLANEELFLMVYRDDDSIVVESCMTGGPVYTHQQVGE